MLNVSQLFIYPIKSLGGISLDKAEITDRGFRYDRRWLLVNEHNVFMTQREFPQMCLLQPSITETGIKISLKKNFVEFFLPFEGEESDEVIVQIWNDYCRARIVSKAANEWFSEMLSVSCRIVFMPEETKRSVDKTYAKNQEVTSFSDAFPFLIIGETSLQDLNSKLTIPLPMNRFRPNIVFSGGEAYEEDYMQHFTINVIDFYGVKPCARCPITTIDQDDATKSKEPLKTLADYRTHHNKVFFGQNLLHEGAGSIHVGDEIIIKERSTEVVYP
ncbi:MAG: MOSC domain-containing protein [Flavisolibacter sp.]